VKKKINREDTLYKLTLVQSCLDSANEILESRQKDLTGFDAETLDYCLKRVYGYLNCVWNMRYLNSQTVKNTSMSSLQLHSMIPEELVGDMWLLFIQEESVELETKKDRKSNIQTKTTKSEKVTKTRRPRSSATKAKKLD
jgi:hypothetical protein